MKNRKIQTKKVLKNQIDKVAFRNEIFTFMKSTFKGYLLALRAMRIIQYLHILRDFQSIEDCISKFPHLEKEFTYIFKNEGIKEELFDVYTNLRIDLETQRSNAMPRFVANSYLMALDKCKRSVIKYNILRQIICTGGDLDKFINLNSFEINFKKPITPLEDQDNTEWARTLRKDLKRIICTVKGSKIPKNYNKNKFAKKINTLYEKHSLPKDMNIWEKTKNAVNLEEYISIVESMGYSSITPIEKILNIFLNPTQELVTIYHIKFIEKQLRITKHFNVYDEIDSWIEVDNN